MGEDNVSTRDSGKRGSVVVVSGPSGVGKSTVCHRLCEMLPAEFSISVTTRPLRPGEQHDKDYRCVDRDEFLRLREAGDFLEWAEVYGNLYGTSKTAIEQAVAAGKVIILEIDINGCVQVRRHIPEAITFFLLPPTPGEQQRRIEGRKTDSAEVIRARLAKADGEIRYASEAGCYDEFIINDDLEETIDKAYAIIRGRRDARPTHAGVDVHDQTAKG
ncbi:MAG: guanylate kinase [Planctomycetota bacterium]